MKTRFVAYNRLGARRGVLTHILQAEIVPSKNELPTLTLTYPRSTPTHKWLLNSPEVAFEYYHNDKWVEPKNARFKLVTQDFDYLEEVETRNYSFIGIGEAIKGVYVFGPNGLKRNEEGKVQFANATPGEMLAHVWDFAVKRGWKGFTRSFTAATDSRPSSGGQVWKNRMSISFADDTSLDSMLNYFSRMGLIDFEWEGRTLHVYNADATMARDLSTGNNPMRFSLSGGRASVDAAPESNDHENLATHVVVTGEEGLRWIFPTGITLPEGRREVFLSYSGVDDEGTALILAQPTIAKYSNSLKNTTRQFQVSESTTALPYIHYGIGDWVLVEKDDGVWERVQIFQLALLVNQNGVQGYVSLGDKIDSLLEKLNEAVQRVQGGSVNEGTEPPTPSSKAPSAPYGLVATARTVYSLKGEAKAVIGVNFAHNGMDVDGDPIAIDTYRVMYRKADGAVGLRGWNQLFTIAAPEQSGTYSYLDVMDHLGNLLTYEFEVIAVSSKGQESLGSSHVDLEMKHDAVPPGKPAKPTIKVALAVFEVGTNHRTVTGAVQDIDYAHTIVEMSTTANGPWVDRTTIVPPIKSAWIGGEGYNTRWFRLVAVDWEGNRSEPSDVVSSTSTQMVDTDLILKELDAAKVIIKNADKILIETGITLGQKLSDAARAIADTDALLTGPGGLTERLDDAEDTLVETREQVAASNTELNTKLTQTNTSLSTARTQLDTLRNTTIPGITTSLSNAEKLIASNNTALTDKLTTASNSIADAEAEITKVVNRVTPLETGINTLTKTTIPGLITSINGKSEIIRSTSAAANQGTYFLGDRWEKWTSIGVGGKLTQTWRHNGTSWIEEILDASYLPLVDIGAGTFGSLSGGRLEVNSVTADKVIIGVGGNLYPDPDMLDAAGYALGTGVGLFGVGSGKTGRGSLLIGANTIQTGAYYGINLANRRIPIVAGGQYLISVWARGAGIPKDGVALYARFYKADGSYAWGKPDRAFNDTPLASNIWTEIKATVTAPEDTFSLVLGFYSQTVNTVAVRFSDPSVRQASGGELIVSGSITGDHIDAESVAAKVGTFIQLNVDQIDVTGNANFKTAVADKLFANMFATNKLTANQVLVGKGENLIPWFGSAAAGVRTWEPHTALRPGMALTFDGVGGRAGGPHALLRDDSVGTGDVAVLRFQSGYTAKDGWIGNWDVEPGQKYIMSMWIRSGGVYSNGAPTVRLQALFYRADATNGSINPAGQALTGTWSELRSEVVAPDDAVSMAVRIVMNRPGHVRIEDPMLVKDGASLIATGGIVSDHITASESMSAKIGQFLTLDVGKLVVTGNSNLDEVVANKMFSNIFATNRLTANQILIGEGGNIFADPNFLDPTGWSSNHYITKAAGRNGNNGFVMPAGTSVQQGTYYGSTDRNRQFAVIPGASYKLSAWVKPDAAVPINGVAVYMKWSTPSSATSGSFATPSLIQNKEALKAGVWAEISGVVTVGDTASKGFIGLYSQTVTTTRVIFSEPSVVQAVDQGLIVDNGIIARHITASEEMSAKIGTFLELNVSQLVATGTSKLATAVIDNLWTNVVRSRSITTDMLVVGKGTNLIPNGDLANGREGWTSSFGHNSNDSLAQAEGFQQSLWYEGYSTGNSASFSVKAGATYQFSMYARANTTGKRFYVQLITNDADAASPHLVQNQLTYTAYTKYEAEVEIPANVTSAYLRVFANHPNGSTQAGHQWFTGFELHEKNGASLIVTGGIVTKHLKVTEDMTVALLKVHKVEADELNFNSLFGDSGFIGNLRTTVLTTNSVTADIIKADAITSKHTLTGPLIRTAASGARTEITRDGMRNVNAAGQELVKIGYGIETGISLRNPANNTLTPISSMVFGLSVARTDRLYPATLAKVGDSQASSPSPGDIFTASGSRAVMLITVNGYSGISGSTPGGTTGNVMVEGCIVKLKATLKLVGSSGSAPTSWGTQVAYLNAQSVANGSELYSSSQSFSVEVNNLLVGRDYEIWVGYDYISGPVILNNTSNSMTFPQNIRVSLQSQVVVIPR